MDIADLEDYRSPDAALFDIGPVPGGSFGDLIGLEAGELYPSAGDGVYLLLAPLPPGEHTLHFGGAYAQGSFSLDVTYHITVDPQA